MKRSLSFTTSQISSAAIWRASDSTRVLRLPGFARHKLPEEFIVQARQESEAVHTLRDFTIDDDSPETPRHFSEAQERRRTVPSDHKSQSEHDWAYAKPNRHMSGHGSIHNNLIEFV